MAVPIFYIQSMVVQSLQMVAAFFYSLQIGKSDIYA